MREFEYKINPFLVSVRFSGGSSEQSTHTGKSLVENRDEIIFEHDFELIVLVILPVKGFEQRSRIGLRGKERKLIPTI